MTEALTFMVGIGVGTVITSVALLVAMMTDEIREEGRNADKA